MLACSKMCWTQIILVSVQNECNAAHCFATPAFAVFQNTRHDQIAIGCVTALMTSLGLGTHPMSQALQEYPEVSKYDQVHQMLAKDAETVQMLARVGYGSNAIATPRWALETR